MDIWLPDSPEGIVPYGLVSVHSDDVRVGEGFSPGFSYLKKDYCFHCHDPFNEGRVLYKDVTSDP